MYPNFMCIGAQKAGTTWLYYNLKNHPQIGLPPLKRIDYFRNTSRKPLIMNNLFCLHKRHRLCYLIKKVLKLLRRGQSANWYLRYLFQKRSDDWYASLFPSQPGMLTADISPAYATVDTTIVEHIYALMPKLKIIYLLRNPIDRIWSHIAMNFAQIDKKSFKDLNEKKIKNFLNKAGTVRHSQYLQTLKIWEKIYPKEQIFIGFYEQLKEAPKELFKNILNFLEIDPSFTPKNIEKPINVGNYAPIPCYWASYLAQRHYSDIQLLHEHFNNTSTAGWLESTERYLSRDISK